MSHCLPAAETRGVRPAVSRPSRVGAKLRLVSALLGAAFAGVTAAHAQQTVVANYFGASLTIVDLATGNRTVLSSASVGTGTTFTSPVGTTRDANGAIIVGTEGGGTVFRVDPTNGNRTVLSSSSVGTGPALGNIYGMATEADGNLLAADYSNTAIIRINPTTGDRTVVTSASVGSGATMRKPFGMVVDPDGSIVFVPWGNASEVIRVNPTTGARTVVSSASVGTGAALASPPGITRLGDGSYAVLNIGGNANYVLRVDPTTGDRTVISSTTVGTGVAFSGLHYSVATDVAGNLYVADCNNNSIVRIDPATGNRTTVSSGAVGTGTALDFPLGMLGGAVASITNPPPTVTTTAASSIAGTSATLGGNVTAAGGSAVTASGIVWSVTATNSSPTIGGTGVTTVAIGSGTGAFSQSVTGLPGGTGISFRAYGTNGGGTGYGATLTFTTLAGNAAPTDLALSNSSVNQSAGLNATVGTLTTTDGDSSTFTYSLVSGTGATDNASFNLSGATLRANDPSALPGGTYSVRIQTDDGSGGTFAKSFTITVVDNTAPVITSATTASATYRTAFAGYTITASGGATSFGATGLPTGLAVNPSTGAITGTPTQSGTFTVALSATDAASNTGTGSLTLTVAKLPLTVAGLTAYDKAYDGNVGASLVTGTASLVGVASGDTVTLDVSAVSGTFADAAVGPGKTVTIAGLALGGTHAAHYTLTQPTTTAAITKAAQSITFTAPTDLPTGTPIALTATASSGLAVTFSVVSGNATIAGATLTLNDVAAVTVRASQAGNANYLAAATELTLQAPRTDRLIGLSTRGRVTSDVNRRVIAGFVIGGSGNARVLLRAVGPALTGFGVGNALANPRLQLYNSQGTLLLENDDWSSDVAAVAAQVGVFPLTPGSRDAAVVTTLAPGAYTVHVLGGTDAGVALAEVYDAPESGATGTRRLVDISSRGNVETGESILIAGFTIEGNASRTVLIRGIGPTLASHGVGGVLADPRLALYSGTTLLAQNDDWGTPQALAGSPHAPATAQAVAAAVQSTGAFALANGSKDASIVVTLPPGAYTAQVSSANAQPGVALVEIYEVP